jgi:hypothetical protein
VRRRITSRRPTRRSRPSSRWPPSPPSAGGDTIAELERLATLKQQRLLSEDEFAAAKAKLLGI